MSLDGLSNEIDLGSPVTINEDDVIRSLDEKSKEEIIDREQKEIFKLMSNNRERRHYKEALDRTIKRIMSNGETDEGKKGE